MAGIIISPSIEQKIRSRNAAMRLKNGSPKFRDVLRQRCRQRIKESRGRLFDDLRHLQSSESIRRVLSDVVRQELSQVIGMEDDGSDGYEAAALTLNQMEQEVLTEEEEWLMSQYDLLLADDTLQQLFEEANQVICPVCQKGNLQHDAPSTVITCSACRMVVPARAPLPQVCNQIHSALDSHSESGCIECPRFFISEEENAAYLYVMCDSCLFLTVIV